MDRQTDIECIERNLTMVIQIDLNFDKTSLCVLYSSSLAGTGRQTDTEDMRMNGKNMHSG